ncbi:MAG: putative zinc-binding metallopeptidase, partial [Ramlibacter sp.]
GSDLAFLPDRLALCAIEPVPGQESALWRRKASERRRAGVRPYRLCHNHTAHQACNFAVDAADPNPLCVSCRQTRFLPDLSMPGNKQRWIRIEAAKRRLFYSLARLHQESVNPQGADGNGPIFEFLADQPGRQVMTGHRNGIITLNVAEADDDERVRRRLALHEPYRTLLGHLRHESGHFYWDRLIRDAGRTGQFRATFGDETQDYGQCLARHYTNGAPVNWQDTHVTAYATAHPWEDWAETWAHYLHMVDLLETAASYSTRVVVPGTVEADSEEIVNPFAAEASSFNQLVDKWVPVTLLLNSLNRSLGQDDAYPFALTAGALEKLRFVHEVMHAPHVGVGAFAPDPAVASGANCTLA